MTEFGLYLEQDHTEDKPPDTFTSRAGAHDRLEYLLDCAGVPLDEITSATVDLLNEAELQNPGHDRGFSGFSTYTLSQQLQLFRPADDSALIYNLKHPDADLKFIYQIVVTPEIRMNADETDEELVWNYRTEHNLPNITQPRKGTGGYVRPEDATDAALRAIAEEINHHERKRHDQLRKQRHLQAAVRDYYLAVKEDEQEIPPHERRVR